MGRISLIPYRFFAEAHDIIIQGIIMPRKIKDAIITLSILAVTFFVNLLIQILFQTDSLIPMVSVLGVFLIAFLTQGYFWGIAASVINVAAVNFAFTYPYYAFDFFVHESISSAVVMLIVAIMTGTLTTKIKEHEKVRVESEREIMRANLLRAMSHDIRTPLTAIYGATSTVIENYDSLSRAQQIKLLDDVRDDADWLIRMVENLLSVTRIDGGRVQVAKTPTVLEELIDTAVLKFKKRYPQAPLTVTAPDDFIIVAVDPLLIEQVLINLLENAVLHAEGMTEVRLAVSDAENSVTLEISDNGCGIPEAMMDRLFTGAISSEKSSPDARRNSMGIGLSVCSAIIKAHGSTITAENCKDGGACFRFMLRKENAEDGKQ